MIKFKNATNKIIIGLFTIVLIACSTEEDDELTNYINAVKQRKAKPIEPIPTFGTLEKFVFPEIDPRRSPFKQKEVVKTENTYAPNTKRPKQPLELYPLDALKFAGVLKQGATIWGLIKLPNGEIARVKIGDYMGQNYGKVISITETLLKIEESVQVGGKWERKVTVFNINAVE